ncbi:MAG TPA: hypothetical protein VK158_00265 [Acidobacteriota bacterium]|nr:hypothetical protein [Acidobacteriota bacterium]
MRYTALFALLAALILLSACTTEPATQINATAPTPNQTSPPVQEQQIPPVTQPTVNQTKPAEEIAPPSTGKVSADSVFVKGTRYSDKNYVNLAYITYSEDLAYEDMTIVIGNKFYTGTYKYNATISCDNIARVIGARNKYFSTKMNGSNTIICLAPPRDLGASESVNMTGTIGTETVLEQTLKMPAVIASTEFYLKD